MSSIESLKTLLKSEDFEKIELALKEPNIFESLELTRQEIRHSNFLAWIVDPNENHGVHDLFIKRMLRDLFDSEKSHKRTIFDADSLDYTKCEIRREWHSIDLLIVLPEDVVAIENKIDTEDHSNQLLRYKKAIEDVFPGRYQHYVYLTRFGDDPRDVSAHEFYINYSYALIAENLKKIIDLYSDSINPKALTYIKDYLVMVRRNILMDDDLNNLAVTLYKSHKDALDFIFENKPDLSTELHNILERLIKERGWVSISNNKGHTRFVTKELDECLPVGKGEGWPQKEIFGFEILHYQEDRNIQLKSVVAPGDEQYREVIKNALMTSKNYKKPYGAKWLINYAANASFSPVKIMNESTEDIEKKLNDFFDRFEPVVIEFSSLIANAIKESGLQQC